MAACQWILPSHPRREPGYCGSKFRKSLIPLKMSDRAATQTVTITKRGRVGKQQLGWSAHVFSHGQARFGERKNI